MRSSGTTLPTTLNKPPVPNRVGAAQEVRGNYELEVEVLTTKRLSLALVTLSRDDATWVSAHDHSLKLYLS